MQWHSHEILFFFGFIIFILMILSIDLGVFNKKSHTPSFREALSWTAAWVALSFLFYVLIRFFGHQLHDLQTIQDIQNNISLFRHPIRIDGLTYEQALDVYNRNLSLEYITGYLIEYSLSVDNIFVMIMIFVSFGIPSKYYHKVLFWGILGAIVMRFLFIFAASALIQRFEAVLYLFGAMLIFIGIKMGYEFIKGKVSDTIDTQHHPVVRFLSKHFNVTSDLKGGLFFHRAGLKVFITPLLIVLVLIEVMDVIFAVDSVPAVFSVTRDPYIVFFSNIFAILGLRSLFFLVNNVMNKFYYLKLGLAFLMAFVGVKMIVANAFDIHISTKLSLGVITGILAFFIVLSVIFPKKEKV
ncbi:MAG: TerC/Alx family metal homeostasis membrane protein [Bacteroidota bacterium]|nr:TerC/Alx family metal homeostasis membrane protein [Bacteroidota bacterium]